jgi:hypothetical protein
MTCSGLRTPARLESHTPATPGAAYWAFTGEVGSATYAPAGSTTSRERPPRLMDTVSEGPTVCSPASSTPSPGMDRPAKPMWMFEEIGRFLKPPRTPP